MSRTSTTGALPPAQRAAEKAFNALERFLHIEAVSGIVLLIAAAAALIWANSPAAASYEHLWHLPISVSIGEFTLSQTLHFLINDAFMTVFFLVVGMEIRREIHDGALQSIKLAALPVAAAIGGVLVPALVYLSLAGADGIRDGWAVPTATDIAFAVGVLALLGKSIPGSVRVFLLTLAIIDDIVAVMIIALFYSSGLDPMGFAIAGVGIALAFGLQHIGIGSAYAYVVPGAVLWIGLLKTGAHPTLAGVVLGLMTPVVSVRSTRRPVDAASDAIREFIDRLTSDERTDPQALLEPVKQLRFAQRELLPPVLRVQAALHPWVAFGIMPLFALANAGVNLGDTNLAGDQPLAVLLGVALALIIGKPIGVLVFGWLPVRLGWCQLPPGMSWHWMALIGCLTGIGFTMSIFIANLAFADADLLGAAKLGVLIASAVSGLVGLALGAWLVRRARRPV
jgi:NhaA family Na+:H+ antiporter